MKVLKTSVPELELVQPDIERDAPISLQWLEGDIGRNTLRLMGNSDEENKPSTLDAEKDRVKNFIKSSGQLTWMMKFEDKIVGTIWVNLEDGEHVPGPSLHIMIGDPSSRGHGIGTSAVKTVIDYLKTNGRYEHIYSRHLVENRPAANLLESVGFEKLGEEYYDSSNLFWQNEILNL